MSLYWDELCKLAVSNHVQDLKRKHDTHIRSKNEEIKSLQLSLDNAHKHYQENEAEYERKRHTCIDTIVKDRATIKKYRATIRRLRKEKKGAA